MMEQTSAIRKKHILLAVTGSSPQVVTETLYAIHKQGLPWPDEIQIITTSYGKEQARLGLLNRDIGKVSVLEQLCKDYQHPLPAFSVDKILVVPDANGKEVDDARTKEDQEALADFIVQHVAQLCNDGSCQIHASLAGGRKTMTFYLGYAMTLFARPEDRLSHVLISPQQYEGLTDFYYPTPCSRAIKGKNESQLLDSSEVSVSVELSEIPFIRHRNQIEKSLLTQFSNAHDKISYRQLVEYQNLAADPKCQQELSLEFELKKSSVTLMRSGHIQTVINFQENPLELAFYAMIARHNTCVNPVKFHRQAVAELEQRNADLFFQELERMHGLTPCLETDAAGYGERMQHRDERFFKDFSKTIQGLKTTNGYIGLSDTFIDQRKNTLKKILSKQFPKVMVDILLPDSVFINEDKETKPPIYILRTSASSSKQTAAMGLKVRSNLSQ